MVVVLMVTDNMAYLVETEEGESHLPKKEMGWTDVWTDR